MENPHSICMMPEASANLIEIVDYIRMDSPATATSVIQESIAAIDSLALMPHRFRVHKSATNPNRIVRCMIVGSFAVYYRIRETERWLEILCVFRGAHRQPRRFK